MKQFRVTIEYIAMDHMEHTIQASFVSLELALTKTKATCRKGDILKVKKILIEEI